MLVKSVSRKLVSLTRENETIFEFTTSLPYFMDTCGVCFECSLLRI